MNNSGITRHNEERCDHLSYTPYSACNYLPNEIMRFAGFTVANGADDKSVQACIQAGYRRSGLFVYKTNCLHCTCCTPVRIDVNRFTLNRTQKRILMRKIDYFSVKMVPLVFRQSHYDLYSRYLQIKHPNSEMAIHNNPLQYQQFILQTPVTSYLFEFSKDTEIDIVCLVDALDDGLSAVYTFYNPFMPKSSLGIFAILWQIELAKQLGKPYLYLGYYIAGCAQMSYKRQFSGLEAYVGGQWIDAELLD